MGGILKQYAWIFDLAVIILCSFFLAKIVSTYIGKTLEVQRSIGVLKKIEGAAARETIPLTEYQVIIDRNIFDSSEAPPSAETGDTAADKDFGEITTGEAVKTSLPVKVWAVLVVGAGRDKRSSATVESSAGGAAGIDVYAVGQEPAFAPNTKIVLVAPDRIEFLNSGRLEYAEIAEMGGPSIFGPPVDTGTPVAALEAPPAGEPLITSEGESKFVIDQREVANALGNIDQLYTDIRAVPNFQGGKMAGMKILSVKKGSVFDKLGMRRGDVLQRINGMELDVRRGFEIFNQLKDTKSLTLDLIRQGQPRTFDYEIR